MRTYKCLNKSIYSVNEYSIIPIRNEDRYLIMQWRNDQIYHLRQQALLTKEKQAEYFEVVVKQLFQQDKPKQLLFSYLENGRCIGYGGLVHINWKDRHAEISFIMDTQLEKLHFAYHWQTFLNLIEQVAFKQLLLHKIFTYAFNLRPHLYTVLEASFYIKEAVFKEHCFFNGNFIDVIIHSKINSNVKL